MVFYLGSRSVSRLEGVHPDLVRVVKRAITLTRVDFGVSEGRRSMAKQRELFEAGATKILDSRHITGHAVDLYAYVAGEARWDWPLYAVIAKAMKDAAVIEGVSLRWGGDWDGDGDSSDEKFKDGPHFELPRKQYPV